MEKTTMYLTEELKRDLKTLAKRTGRPQADLIREALVQYLQGQEHPRLPSWVGIASVGGDAGKDKRRYREEWIDHIERKPEGDGR
jgi:predicted transcriptional regulator